MQWKKTAVVAVLAIGAGTVATAAPAFAGTGSAAPAGQSAKAGCSYDICMYTGKNFTGKYWGYNHYKNHCASFDNAVKIRSLKINSSKGTTFWSKKGCKGTPSMSFAGHAKVKNYKFTARSGR